jgi:ferric enterobactin receptor
MNYLRRLLLLISPLLFSSHLIAQPSADTDPGIEAKMRITGRIVDASSDSPLEYAAVSVLSQGDSSLVTGGVSDLDGNIDIETGAGNFIVKIEFISYKSKWIDNIKVSREKPVANLGIVNMEPDGYALMEVEIRAEKSQMQMTLDKKVFNVGKDLASTSGSAAQVLDNVPSVTVDVDGNVSLRGSENVRVLIDGKPSGLVGVRGTDGLRSLPANLIDQVEIITNPSARYEAEGMTGIINIILKKDRQKGVNGSFDLTTGFPHDHGAAVNLNFRQSKFNLFTNYSLRYRNRPGENTLYQEYYRNDTTFFLDQTRTRERGGWSNNLRLGADYFFNDNNILTTSFLYRMSNDDNRSDLVYYDYVNDYPGNLTRISFRNEKEKETEPTLEYALNYKRTFQRQGHELRADFQMRRSTEEEIADYSQESFRPDFSPITESELLQRSSNRESEASYLLQIDYVHPFGKEGKFETGYRGSLRFIDNDYLVEEFDDIQWNRLPGLSNDFNYDERIHAAYASLGNKTGRFSYQMGLRLELSEVLTELLQTNEINDRNYINLFPTAHLTYEFPAQNSFQISYSRRINRPNFWSLNPFFTFSDNRNIFRGNPNLDPEFTHSFELGHIKYWNSASISSSVYYRHTDGVIQRIRTLEGEGEEAITITQPENLATENSYGLEFILSSDLAKWWKIDGNFNFFRSIIDGGNIGETIQTDTYSWFARVNSRTTLWKKIDLQLRFFYQAPRDTPQGKARSMTQTDLGLSREILKGKGTLTLSVRDLFNTRRYRYETFGDNFFSSGSHQWRARQATLTFNYRLNQTNFKKEERGGRDENGGGNMEF